MRVGPSFVCQWCAQAEAADHIIANSAFTQRSLTESGIAQAKITVVPLGVDTQTFCPADVKERSEFKVLFVGSRVARTGFGQLLRAWYALSPKNARLIVIGVKGEHKVSYGEVDGRIEEKNVATIAELARAYNEADLFVMPSLAEGFGQVYLEALACGTPVLGTTNSGAADIVAHGVDGFIVPSGDSQAFVETMDWILKNRDIVRAMRDAAASAGRAYTWDLFRARIGRLAASLE